MLDKIYETVLEQLLKTNQDGGLSMSSIWKLASRNYDCRIDHVGVCMKAAEILARPNNACKQIVISRVVEDSGPNSYRVDRCRFVADKEGGAGSVYERRGNIRPNIEND